MNEAQKQHRTKAWFFSQRFVLLIGLLLFSGNTAFAFIVNYDDATGKVEIIFEENDRDLTITRHPDTGGLALNGECSNVPTVNIKHITIRGNDYNNNIDLTHMGKYPDFSRMGDGSLDADIFVDAKGGNDSVNGAMVWRNKIYGGDGRDSIEGGDEDDIIWGGDGNDSIRGRGGADYANGGKGQDFLYLSEEATGFAGAGNDVIRIDYDLLGQRFFAHGGDGNDLLKIWGTINFLKKHTESYTSENILADAGHLFLTDSSGVDTLDFSELDKGINIDFNLWNTPQIATASDDTLTLYGLFENIIGTKYNDVLKVTPDISVPIHVNGGDSTGVDTLYVDGGDYAVHDDGSTITVADFQPITYENIDHVVRITTSGVSQNKTGETPDDYRLYQNYPNPFNPVTSISYFLSKKAYTTLRIFNTQGQIIKTLIDKGEMVGEHQVFGRGENSAGQLVSSGVYFYVMEAVTNDGKIYRNAKKMIKLD